MLGGTALLCRRVHRRTDRGEEGVFLVIYALALVSIFLFAALAIDLGNIIQTKQHAQNAADDAAVSAVGDLAPIASGSAAGAQEQLAVTDVESFVSLNYSSISPSSWNTCPVNVLPANVSASPQSNCIGFFNPNDPSENLIDPTGLAVVIPSQTVNYSFGKVGGLTKQDVSAVAEASVQNPGAEFLLPFGYAPGGGNGLQCLKTGSGSQAASCTGFAIGAGQFGVLDSPRYRICFNACPATSNSAGNNSVVMGDIDLGIDHRLNIFTSAPDICDATGTPPNCTQYNDTPPYDDANSAAPLTGQTLNDPGPAFFNADQNSFTIGGCTIDTPRLDHPDGFEASGTCTSDNPTTGAACPCLSSVDSFGSGDTLNGVHISDYLLGGTTNSYFASCYNGNGPGGMTPNPSSQPVDAVVSGTNIWTGSSATEDGCLSTAMQGMSTSSPPIFSSAIADSPRFGIVPVVAPVNGRQSEAIVGFLGVYLDMAFGTGNKVDAMEAWVFPLNLIQPAGTNGGAGLEFYGGGPYVTNLCSLQAGNC